MTRKKQTENPSRFYQWMGMMEEASTYIIEEKVLIDSPKNVSFFLAPLVKDELQEKMYVFCLNSKNRVIHFECVSIGTVDRTIIHPRDIFRMAIAKNAARIILAHNHPSGDPRPSVSDIDCTDELKQAGKILQIQVVDHVIIGNGKSFYSFSEKGMM